jgi:hypothetical protein
VVEESRWRNFRGSKQTICVRHQNNNLRINVRGILRQVLNRIEAATNAFRYEFLMLRKGDCVEGDAKGWNSSISRLKTAACCSQHRKTMLQSFLELDVCSSGAKTFVCSRVVPKRRGSRPRFGPTDRRSLSSCIPTGRSAERRDSSV